MPRNNTEIDKDLEKTKGAVESIDKGLVGFKEQLLGLRREIDLREASHEKSLKHAEDDRERLRQDLKTAEKSLGEMRSSIASLGAKLDRLEKAVVTMESRRWQLYVAVPVTAVISAIIAAAGALGKGSIVGWIK